MPADEAVNPYAAPNGGGLPATAETDAAVPLARARLIVPDFGASGVICAGGVPSPHDFFQVYKMRGGVTKIALLFLLIVVATVAKPYMDNRLDFSILGFAVCLSLVLIGLLVWYVRRAVFKQWRKRAGAFDPRVYLFAAEGLAECSNTGVGVQPWKAMKNAKRGDDLVVLCFANQNNFLPISRSRFASQADWDQFSALVDDKLPSR